MAITLYRKDNGAPVIFAHIIDAKESMQSGFYSEQAPPVSKVEVPEKVEVKPIVGAKKPIIVKKEEPVVKKEEPIIEEKEVKPEIKPASRIIRK